MLPTLLSTISVEVPVCSDARMISKLKVICRKLTAGPMNLGVAADLSHINTNSTVTGYDPTPSGLRDALKGSEVVLIPAGVPRKPGMTRDGMMAYMYQELLIRLTIIVFPDLFNTNASIVRDLAKAAADASPEANILVISNPVSEKL